MANPTYYHTSPPVRSQVQHQEHLFHLYAHQHFGNNEFCTVQPANGVPNSFGQSNVFDWDIRDVPDTNGAVVAQMRGVGISSGRSNPSWHNSFNVVFTDKRFKGSTLCVQGPLGPPNHGDEGDLAVVGGTGEFVYAQGIFSYKRIQVTSGEGIINELRIRVVCITFPKPVQVQKIGPWGGNGGNAYDIRGGDLPQRLESLSIYAEDFIQSIAFTYTDQTGQKQTVGPWGGDDGKSELQPIQFGPTETINVIYGSTGNYDGVHTAVTSLTIVTNVTSYGPYGKQSAGNTFFHIAPPNNQNIVGFYGSVGEVVHQIGVYVTAN